MKKCKNCGELIKDNDKYCPHCGVYNEEYKETIDAEVVNGNEGNATFAYVKDISDYEKRASTAFTLSIVSVILCCCTITAIISLILSITLYIDLNKINAEGFKSSNEYRKIKNKTIAAMIISAILVFMGVISGIETALNADQYTSLYDSLMNDAMNGAYE